jgi:hypothetical protein
MKAAIEIHPLLPFEAVFKFGRVTVDEKGGLDCFGQAHERCLPVDRLKH